MTVEKGFEALSGNEKALEAVPLIARGTWPESTHVFDKRDLLAIDAARSAKRPLLVRGEPGTGKSQLARAAAQLLDCHFFSKVIDAQTEIDDLWFRYDAVMRLGEAQVLGSPGGQAEDAATKLELARYIIPGPMWWAYDFNGAAQHCEKYGLSHSNYVSQLETETTKDTVLLLDEIDKAEADLANSLLEALGNRSFRIDMLDKIVGKGASSRCELVIITSNEERQLPPAFLRRCVVLKLSLPKGEKAFCNLLVLRGKQHHKGNPIDDEVLLEAASLLWQDRLEAEDANVPLPGQAEYLDMLSVLAGNASSADKQLKLLGRVREFVYHKHDALLRPNAED